MKYVVLKVEDIEKHLSGYEQMKLAEFMEEIRGCRVLDGKKGTNKYLVVNVDEPYAHNVKTLIEEHEGEKVSFE